MTAGRRFRAYEITEETATIIGINIRTLRQRKGWSQRQLGELMGWPHASTVCGAEGHRSGRQRSFTVKEVWRLAAIFHVSYGDLTTRCASCDGHPPVGFACLACGAVPDGHRSAQSCLRKGLLSTYREPWRHP